MDEITKYRRIIRELIQRYAAFRPARGDVQIEVILDEGLDHYELMYAGWNGPYRIHGSVLHIDIRAGKVWIQQDGTEDGIAEELVAAGVPREHIVLAFKPPDVRKHTDFAVA
jgi:ketopantoate reductase